MGTTYRQLLTVWAGAYPFDEVIVADASVVLQVFAVFELRMWSVKICTSLCSCWVNGTGRGLSAEEVLDYRRDLEWRENK